jgi:hypothetical protein
MTGLFLEHRLGLPCDTCLRLALHDPQRRLPVMDVRQHGRPVGDFGAVDFVLQRVAARTFERRLDLPCDPFECGIRHRQPDVRFAEIRESRDMSGIARRHHDGQRVCHVRHRRRLQTSGVDLLLHGLQSREIHVGWDSPGHVADRDRAAAFHLLHQQAWRNRLPVDMAFVLRVTRLECLNEGCHRKEVVAADIEHQRRVNRVTMEIGKIVGVGFGERQTAHWTVIVRAVLPRWIDVLAMRGPCGTGGRVALGISGPDEQRPNDPHHACSESFSVNGKHVTHSIL